VFYAATECWLILPSIVYNGIGDDMLQKYRTVKGYGTAEIEINKSRFITYINRAETEQEAIRFIEKIKKQHWDATHNCSAYVSGEFDQHQKADDDGEPSGTAGKPILEVIKKSAVKDTVIVVTRYFGGTKLGAGGLIRAYGKAASQGLKAAGLIERTLHTKVDVTVEYTFLGKLENELRNYDYHIAGMAYTDKVTLTVLAEKGYESVLETRLQDWTGGQAVVEHNGETYLEVSVE